MLRFALGTLGWPPAAVWAATPREIAAALPAAWAAPMRAADLARLLDLCPDPARDTGDEP